MRVQIKTILLGITLAGIHQSLAAATLPEPGAESEGLRLRLSVANPKKTEKQHQIRLELLNVSDKPITLLTRWQHEREKGGFATYLKNYVGVVSDPKVLIRPYSSIMRQRTSPQESMTLKARGSLVISWTARDGSFWDRDEPRLPSAPRPHAFPGPGLYSTHVQVYLKSEDGHSIFLRSNVQPFIVGHSIRRPKQTHAKIYHFSKDRTVAKLNAGKMQGIRKGDVFVDYGKGRSPYQFVVQKITDWECVVSQVNGQPIPAGTGQTLYLLVDPQADAKPDLEKKKPSTRRGPA